MPCLFLCSTVWNLRSFVPRKWEPMLRHFLLIKIKKNTSIRWWFGKRPSHLLQTYLVMNIANFKSKITTTCFILNVIHHVLLQVFLHCMKLSITLLKYLSKEILGFEFQQFVWKYCVSHATNSERKGKEYTLTCFQISCWTGRAHPRFWKMLFKDSEGQCQDGRDLQTWGVSQYHPRKRILQLEAFQLQCIMLSL